MLTRVLFIQIHCKSIIVNILVLSCPSMTAVFQFSCDYQHSDTLHKKLYYVNLIDVQSPLEIVDSSVSSNLSTITRESTIKREIHAKIDN